MLISNEILLIALVYIILICLFNPYSAVNPNYKGGVIVCQMPSRWKC